MSHYPPRSASRRMPDTLRERIGFWVSVTSLLTGIGVIFMVVTSKLGILILGPADAVAQVQYADSLGLARIDSMFTAKAQESARIHARVDSLDREQDRRIASVESKLDIIVALGCANFPRRDVGVSRLEATCSTTLDRWRSPGGRP